MTPTTCPHLRSGTWPLRWTLVLDDQLGPADGLASCRECGAAYLLEMLDWRGSERLLRLAVLRADVADRLLHDLERGSCDAGRAAAELSHVRSLARTVPWLLLVDTSGPRIVALVPAPADRTVPTAGWRELPCDGAWIDYARSYVEMVNE
jgi:hypothetical protein